MRGKVVIAPASATPKNIDIFFTLAQKTLPKELASIKFSYTITGEGDLSNVSIKRGRPFEEVNNQMLDTFFGPTMQANKANKAQFTLQPGKATKVTIQFFIERDGNTICIGNYVWNA